jgi:transglutaminase-like putative cysteine protease
MTDPAQPVATRHVRYLLLSLTMVAAPHAFYLPWWIIVLTSILVAWRALLRNALPGRWVLVLIAGAATVGVLTSYRTIFGREAGVALLVIMLGLKFLETRTLRDAVLLIYLGFFLVITNFLRDQTITVAVYMLACTVVITATLVALNHAKSEPPFSAQLARAGMLLAQSVPLMLVLFLLFPRVPGPLWGLPQDTRTGVSGLSDTMTPGSLSQLTLSDEVAFRVKFEGETPRRRDLYWRGPVMWDFDGRTWTVPRFFYNTTAREVTGTPISYEVILEPHNQRWLFALDVPGQVPPAAFIGGDFQLFANEPVKNRLRYDMKSYLGASYGLVEGRYMLNRALHLPEGQNPRTLEFARALRQKHPEDMRLIEAVLEMFRGAPFGYTLEPPLLGEHPVDEFLFSTRSGFCEHYASAFAVLMRGAGIPARIVTGYHGGDINQFGNYLIVRQAEAHAWAEVWLADRGWLRIDPTSAVSPLRVDSGISVAVQRNESLPMMVRGDFETLRRLRLSWDYVATAWNDWVLAYTPERQRWLLSRMGVDHATWEKLTAILLVLSGLVVGILTVLALRQMQRRVSDPVRIAYARFCDKLRRKGLPRDPAEGPMDYAHRVGRSRPDLQPAVAAITGLYVTLRYAGAGAGAGLLDDFRQRVRRFKA